MSDTVTYELRDDVALIRIDDGKANAISHAVLDALTTALDQAEQEAKAVVITGRPGRFSAGFDLSVMGQGGEAVGNLVGAGAHLALRLYAFPLPVVIACTGHAIAMGAILLFSADARIGTEGSFKIGMNEVAIGMTLPHFAIDFARERLSKRHFDRAASCAVLYDPATAVDAGYLDRTAAPEALLDEALAEAAELAKLNGAAHHATKLRTRGPAIDRMRAQLEADMKTMTSPTA